ncbi:UDENN FNIP1/2-type domain-containing protein [Schizosaccharomyces pombe]|uniref:Uncharacterized protein C30C2.07 n=1 Tax=Schizosaccharomyces pombe (strain 972 / ATCC 24843) TaxID=284812 RepID=YLF7_SCHPO|nr:uncharacterized protein SPAC30C2.07 [Schizosaccharomyces pombe]Q9P6K4.1 RecName: Full=Uncharacterized protein C30C2.07 [Schizosaccharomyces pombe 972h-]CAB90794.1 sequence orphan [Schizosaccharomyces pombe]|eukprot:NP_594659.1 uncharacterized protein SPAC30C2.07 [Schizosaccharomyces pombe]
MLHFLFHSGSSSNRNSSPKESYELLHGLDKQYQSTKDVTFRLVLVQDIGDRKKTVLFDSNHVDGQKGDSVLRDSANAPLTDLMFGAIPISHKGTTTKLHILHPPNPATRSYMLTQLFQINTHGTVVNSSHETIASATSLFENSSSNFSEDPNKPNSSDAFESNKEDSPLLKSFNDSAIPENAANLSSSSKNMKDSTLSSQKARSNTSSSFLTPLHEQLESRCALHTAAKDPFRSKNSLRCNRGHSPLSSQQILPAISNNTSEKPDSNNCGFLLPSNSTSIKDLKNVKKGNRLNSPPFITIPQSIKNTNSNFLLSSPSLFSDTRTRPASYALALIITVPYEYDEIVHPVSTYYTMLSNFTLSLQKEIDERIRNLLFVSLSSGGDNKNDTGIPLIQSSSSKVGFGPYALSKDLITAKSFHKCILLLKTGFSAPLIKPSVFSGSKWVENMRLLTDLCKSPAQKCLFSNLLTATRKFCLERQKDDVTFKVLLQSSKAPIARRFLYLLAPLMRPSIAQCSDTLLNPIQLYPNSGILSSSSLSTSFGCPSVSGSLRVPSYDMKINDSCKAIDIHSEKPSFADSPRKTSLRNYLSSSWRLKFMRSSYQNNETDPLNPTSGSFLRQPMQYSSPSGVSESAASSFLDIENIDEYLESAENMKYLPRSTVGPGGMLHVDLLETNAKQESEATTSTVPPSPSQVGFLKALHPSFDLQAAPPNSYVSFSDDDFISATLLYMLEDVSRNKSQLLAEKKHLKSQLMVANLDTYSLDCYEIHEFPSEWENDYAPFLLKEHHKVIGETYVSSFDIQQGCFNVIKRRLSSYKWDKSDDSFVSEVLKGDLKEVLRVCSHC